MNENEQELENLVMFPAAKNYAPVHSEPLDDPLEQLLTEFADLNDEDFIDEFDEEDFELAPPRQESKLDVSAMGQHDCMELIHEQLNTLNEARSRLSYYLNEIEQHIPRKKK